MKRVFLHLLTVLLTVAVTLGASELALRVADYPKSTYSPWIRMHDTGFGHGASLHTRMSRPGEYDVTFETNSAGLRDDELKPKAGSRVLLIGDSFAVGYGVERPQRFGDLLEERLGVDIVNAAVGGYEIIHQIRYFAERGRALDADLVVYALYLGNDLSRNDEWSIAADGSLVSSERTFPVRVARGFKLNALFKQLSYLLKVRIEQARGEWEPHPDYQLTAERHLSADASADYARVEELLAQLRDQILAGGAKLFVITIPYRTMVDPVALQALRERTPGFDARFDLSLPARRTGEILDRLGIEHFDLSAGLHAHFDGGGPPLYFPIDGHLNVLGNQVVADLLEPELRARVDAIR